METNPPQLDYRTPQAPNWGEPFSAAGFLAGVIIASVLAILLLKIAPHFEQIFRDFGNKLPETTVWLFDASRIARRGGWVVLPMLPVVTGFLVALIGRPSPSADPAEAQASARRRRRWAMRLTIWALLLIGIATAIALFAPMISLIQAVSGSGKK